jgi:hypothetical protein
VRSANRNASGKVFSRIAGLSLLAFGLAEAPEPMALPLPLASLLARAPHANISIVAYGIPEARNLRLRRDGTLLLDAPGDSLEYRVMLQRDGSAEVWLAARELHALPSRSTNHLPTPVHLEWGRRLDAPIVNLALQQELLVLAQSLAREPATEAVLAPDGTMYIAALEAGIIYRVAIPRAVQASLRGQLTRAGFGR